MKRFICLKIWPRLPKQSTRAIRISNSKDSLYKKFFPVEQEISRHDNNISDKNIKEEHSHFENDVFPPPNAKNPASFDEAMMYGPLKDINITFPPPNTNNAASSDDTMMYGPMNHMIPKV